MNGIGSLHLKRGWILTLMASLLSALMLTGMPSPASATSSSGKLGDFTHNTRVRTYDCAKPTAVHGRRILYLGDSITVGGKNDIMTQLTRDGWFVCIDARAGQTTAAALNYYSRAKTFPAYADIIVMATGANDIFDPGKLKAQVIRARQFAGKRPLVWVNAYVNRWHAPVRYSSHDLYNTKIVNSYLVRRAGWNYINYVVDWYGLVTGRVQYPLGPQPTEGVPMAPLKRQLPSVILLKDGVHTTANGSYIRAAYISHFLRVTVGRGRL